MSRSGRVALAAFLLPVLFAAAATGAVVEVVAPFTVGVGILAACALLGASILRVLHLPDLAPLEAVVVATALGVGVVGLLGIALGVSGTFRPGPLVMATAILAGAAALHTRPWKSVAVLSRHAEELFGGRWGVVLGVTGLLFLCCVAVATVLPPWDWDTMMYHLPVPARFLEEGSMLGEPVTVHYGYVGAVHILYALGMAVGASGAAVVVSGGLALLLAAFVFSFVRLELGAGPAALAVAGLAGTTILALVALTPRVDVSLALFLFLTHWSVLRAARGGSSRFLVLAGLLGGVALATKLHAAAYLLPLGLWVVWLLVRKRGHARAAAAGFALFVIVAGPWLARNWVLFSDPVFPLFSAGQIPPWLEDYPAVVEAARSVNSDVIGEAREPVTPLTLLLHPERLSPELEAASYVWSPLLVVGLLFILVSPASWVWAAPAALYATIALGRSGRTNLRYLIPLIAPLSIAATISVHHLLSRWPRVRQAAIVALFAAALAPMLLPLSLVWRWVRAPVESGRYDTIYAAAAAATERVPADGRILMLYEARVLPFDRDVIPDNRAQAWPLLHASGHADTCLRDIPATHVLLNATALQFYTGRAAGRVEYVTDGSLDRFIERCLEVVDRRGGHVLFRIRTGAPASASIRVPAG